MAFSVLFVCMGNICRSPAAECVFSHLLGAKPWKEEVITDSAGTIDMHAGNPPDSRMTAALQRRGIRVFGRARQVTREDLAAFDLILAMDRDNLAYLHYLDRGGNYRGKIRLFGEFCRKTPGEEVPDPYYGGEAGFDLVVSMLEDGCGNLLKYIEGKMAK